MRLPKASVLAFLVPLLALGQTVPTNVQKGGSAGVNNITADLAIGSGRTLTIGSGGTLTGASGSTVTFNGPLDRDWETRVQRLSEVA